MTRKLKPAHVKTHAQKLAVPLGWHALAISLCLAFIAPAPAQAQETPISISLPAQPLGNALVQLANQYTLQLAYAPEIVSGLSAPAISGNLTADQALQRLLAGTGIEFQRHGGNVSLSRPRSDSAAQLAPVTVSGRQDATTEGSGSYAANSITLHKGSESIKDIPQSITVMTRQLMEDQQLTTISEVMEKAPGVVVAKDENANLTFYSRGFRIDNYQLDGTGISFDSIYRPDFDMAMYDRVELLRGAEGLFSAAGEPGGTVNLVRKRPTHDWQYQFTASTGSWKNNRVEADLGGPLAFEGKLRGRVVAMVQDREFFYSPSDERKHLFYGALALDLSPTTLLTAGASYQRTRSNKWYLGIPSYFDGGDIGLDRREALTTDWSKKNPTIKEYFATLEQGLGPNWTATLSAAKQTFDEEQRTFVVQGPIDRTTRAFSMASAMYEDTGNHAKSVDFNLAGSVTLWGRKHQVLVGADWRSSKAVQMRNEQDISIYTGQITLDNFQNLNFPEPSTVGARGGWPDMGAEQKGIYGKLQLQLTDAWRAIVGGRYGNYEYNSDTADYDANGNLIFFEESRYRDTGILTPYAGLVYDLNDNWTAYASWTEIFKPQANYLAGPPGASKALDPIKGRNLELGIKGSLLDNTLQTSLALYRIERTGEAVEDPSYPFTPGTLGNNCCYLAQGELVSQGVDLELSGQLARGWQVFAGYTYNQNKDKSSDAPFHAVTPKHMFKLWTTYQLPGNLSAWTVGAGVTAQSRQTNSGRAWVRYPNGSWSQEAFSISQGGYAVWDASVQYKLAKDWTVALNVKNLFDRYYYQTLGAPRGGTWYGEPRNFALTLRGQF